MEQQLPYYTDGIFAPFIVDLRLHTLLDAARLKDTVALIEGLEGVQRLETGSGVTTFRVE